MEKTHLIYQIIRVSLKMTKNRWRKSSYLPFLMKLDRNSWIFSSYFVCEHFFLVLFYSFDTLLLLRLWSTSTHQLLFNSPTNFLLLLSYFFPILPFSTYASNSYFHTSSDSINRHTDAKLCICMPVWNHYRNALHVSPPCSVEIFHHSKVGS